MGKSARMLNRLLLSVVAATLVSAPFAGATIVALDNSAAFTVAPADNFGFNNVGTVFNSIAGFPCSGVYLGNGWMIEIDPTEKSELAELMSSDAYTKHVASQ